MGFDPKKGWTIPHLAGEVGEPTKLGDICKFDYTMTLGWSGQPGDGYFDLFDRIIDIQQYKIDKSDIIMTCGTQEGNFLALTQSLNPGDKVILETPTWHQFPYLCEAMGAKIVAIPRREELGWKWDIEELKEKADKDTRAICINQPNNPTGAFYNERELRAICEVAEDCGARLISDEIYRGLEWEGPMAPSAINYYDKAVCNSSVSKVLSMDGLRVGWLVSKEKEFRDMITELRRFEIEHINILGTIVAHAALERATYERVVKEKKESGRECRKILTDWMKKNTFFTWVPPSAGFLSFPGYRIEMKALDFCEKFLVSPYPAILAPGSAYGVEKHVRLGFGRVPPAEIKQGLDNLSKFVQTLPK